MRKLIISYFLALLVVSMVWLTMELVDFFYHPFPHHANGTAGPLVIHVDKKSSASAFVHTLANAYLIQSPRLFLWSIRLQGLSNQLKAGIYDMKPGETAQQLLMRVVQGDVYRLSFRVIPGATQQKLDEQLAMQPYLTLTPNAWATITDEHPSAEGLLLADTYAYDAGSQTTSLLRVAHLHLLQCLHTAFEQRTKGLPYKTPYELLIAASIIEKEAANPDEKRLVSGVIVNRLNKRMPLQMDPTVIYALGPTFQGKLTHQDLSVASPYNTYLHYGLPPTPIAMVGCDAILAAAQPILTHYLYYVATGDGRHQFSETYEAQQKAILLQKCKVKPCQH